MEFINSNANLVLGEDSGGKGRHFVSRFIEDGLVSYGDAGVLKVTKEALDKFSQTLVGCPVIIKHQKVNDANADELRSGVISDVYFNADDGWYYCEGVIWDKDALDKIEKGWSVSCCYNMTDSTGDSGEWHNMHYDDELLNGVFEHLAIVPNPRYEEATILLNSKEKENTEMLFKLFNGKKSNEEKSEMVDKKTEADTEDLKENEEEVEVKEEEKEEVENKRNDSESEDKEEEKKASDDEDKSKEEDDSDDEDEEKENEEDEDKEKANKCGSTKSNSKFDKLQELHNSCNAEVKSGYVNEKTRIALGDSLF